MSKKNKQKPWQPVQGQLLEITNAAEVTPGESARVGQLIANGKFGTAVDIAKQVHKRCDNAGSEALLMEAYAARISSLVDRHLDAEAQVLVDLVLERYPSARARLQKMTVWVAARKGDLNALLQPLNDPALTPETRTEISNLIRRNIVDLGALSSCHALPPGHPLRTAAAALERAFKDVTSGPVNEDALALPEVSRHSPLAPWKLLVRAIAAFYRCDNDVCEQCLAAIESDSAAARLVAPMRAMLGQNMLGQNQTLAPAALALVNRAGGDIEALRSALRHLDQVLDKPDQPRTLKLIREAIALGKQHHPELLDRLKQHISVRAMLAGLKPEAVAAAMDGPSLKNAYFWRLMARSAEENSTTPAAIPHACSLWEEFRRHAVHEGWFPAEGPEVATLYLHMADLLSRLEEDDLEEVQEAFPKHFKGLSHYYTGQPPAIATLAPKGRPDTYYLQHEALFDRACQADPRSDHFQRWMNWVKRNRPNSIDIVASRWSEALPRDVPPVLQLMESAEKSNALQRAFNLVEKAEQIDGLNPEVRKARLRLLVSMAARHLKQKKPHLAQRELEQIQALPQAQQGDRPAFVAALRWVWWTLQGAQQEAAAARAEVDKVLKSKVASSLVLADVARICKFKGQIPEMEFAARGERVAEAAGRACALGQDMGARIELPEPLWAQILKELSGDAPVSDAAALGALGEAAADHGILSVAYAVSAAGLAHAATRQARFLFLRARALPPWEERRCEACIGAASELARRDRDLDLLNQIGEWREQALDLFDFGQEQGATMSTEQVNRVIQHEREQKEFQTWGPADDPYECDCPVCRAERRGSRGGFMDEPDFGQPPQELVDMVNQFGPQAVAQAMAEMLFDTSGGRPKRRKRARAGVPPRGFPF